MRQRKIKSVRPVYCTPFPDNSQVDGFISEITKCMDSQIDRFISECMEYVTSTQDNTEKAVFRKWGLLDAKFVHE